MFPTAPLIFRSPEGLQDFTHFEVTAYTSDTNPHDRCTVVRVTEWRNQVEGPGFLVEPFAEWMIDCVSVLSISLLFRSRQPISVVRVVNTRRRGLKRTPWPSFSDAHW